MKLVEQALSHAAASIRPPMGGRERKAPAGAGSSSDALGLASVICRTAMSADISLAGPDLRFSLTEPRAPGRYWLVRA